MPTQANELEKERLRDNLKSGEEARVNWDSWPSADDASPYLGKRVEGFLKSTWQVVSKQNWGFVGCVHFPGQIFWHVSSNPGMMNVEFDREDIVEYKLIWDEFARQKDTGLRAVDRQFVSKVEKTSKDDFPLTRKQQKKQDYWTRQNAPTRAHAHTSGCARGPAGGP